MMLSAPSGATSATIATIFDVPMSRPTIRFLLSFTIASRPLAVAVTSCRPSSSARVLAESRHARRESVAVAQVHVLDARAGARERADRAPVHADEAREPRRRARRARARSRARRRRRARARRQPPRGESRTRSSVERERRERLAPFAVARRHLGARAVRARRTAAARRRSRRRTPRPAR